MMFVQRMPLSQINFEGMEQIRSIMNRFLVLKRILIARRKLDAL
jgi:hypothetical protein